MKTLEQLSNAKDDELRATLAELCGWLWFTDGAENILIRRESAHKAHEVMKPGRTGTGLPYTWAADPPSEKVPNYTSDLNACAEVEETLGEDADGPYIDNLRRVTLSDSRCSQRATARQRTIALILTLQKPEYI